MKGIHVSIAPVILFGLILPQKGINASDFYSKNSQILFFSFISNFIDFECGSSLWYLPRFT